MLRETFPLGHIAGIRVGAHWSALVTLGLFILLLGQSLSDSHGSSAGSWLAAVAGAVVLLATLLAHELAHSVVARRSGVPVQRVVLWLLGGVSELGSDPKDARSDLRIALAGPLTSLALGAVFFGLGVAVGDSAGVAVRDVLIWLAVMNIILGLFNLLPGAPLDGGRVLRAIVWWRTGDQLRAATAAARSGRYLGYGLLAIGAAELLLIGNAGGIWLMLLGWFLSSAANAELATAGLRHQLGDLQVRAVMTPNPVIIPAAWSIADLLASDVLRSDHHVFPVVDASGRPVGIVTWAELTRAAPAARTTTSVWSVMRPLPAGARATEEELLSAAASRAVLRPDMDAVTVVDPLGRIVGIVTATDLTLACHRSALGLPVRPAGSPQPPATGL